MLCRLLIPLTLLLLVSLIALPARAQDCYAKDQIVGTLPPQVHSLKLNGPEADEFRRFANAHYGPNEEQDGEGFTYILSWVDQADSNAVWFIFDQHGCYYARGWIKKTEVTQFIGAES